MDRRRIRYAIALICLIMTVVLITYKLSIAPKSQSLATITHNTGGVIDSIVSNTQQKNKGILVTGRSDLETTLPGIISSDHRWVVQGDRKYLLIDDYFLIPLSTAVYSGVRTGVIVLEHQPLTVYYRYELPTGRGYTYLYELSNNSSRELDQLIIIGKIGKISLFAIRESDGYRGLSMMSSGQRQTLYTGTYQQIQYLGDILKLNNSQEIYLPLPLSGS